MKTPKKNFPQSVKNYNEEELTNSTDERFNIKKKHTHNVNIVHVKAQMSKLSWGFKNE